MVLHEKPPRLGSAVYVLPNLITTGNLFFGFFSIVKSLQFNFEWAASAILLAAVFDVLDGRVARLTGGSSEFGVQYDSLCDLVSFGLAPAFLMYQYGLNGLGRIGWVLCFLFLACGALRLARFNVQSSIGKAEDDFTGLPIPMAAGFVACFVAATLDLSRQTDYAAVLGLSSVVSFLIQKSFSIVFLAIAAPLLAIAMVSNIAYRSHKAVKLKFFTPFNFLVLAVVATAVIAYQPELIGFTLFASYALSGPFEWILGWKKTVNEGEIFSPINSNESILDASRHQFNWHDTPSTPSKELSKTNAVNSQAASNTKDSNLHRPGAEAERRKDQGFK